MGLRGALVDKARTISKSNTGIRIEGTVFRTTQRSEWFRCRFMPEIPSESRDDGQVRQQAGATMLVGTSDVAGVNLAIKADNRVEVYSPQLGNATFQITGNPEPLRKKRRVVGYRVHLVRIGVGAEALRDNADAYNFRMTRGVPFELDMTMLSGSSGSAISDLTGYTASMPIYDRFGGSTVLTTLSSPSGGITLDSVTGSIKIIRSGSQISAYTWDYGYYSLRLTKTSDGSVHEILNGSIEIVRT